MKPRFRIPPVCREGPVVMVDDEELDIEAAFRGYRKSRLENEFISFGDGPPFLEHLEDIRRSRAPVPALVMLDINMPQMSGIEVLKSLRGDPAFREIPVVTMLTSSTHDRDRELALANGANDYLIKPSNYNDYTTFFDALLIDE